MSASRAIGAGGSMALHVVLAAAFLWPAAQPLVDVPLQSQPDDRTEIEMRLISSSERDGDGQACDGSYRGIGVVMAYSGYVEEVVLGGPADRAGMHIGDKFLNAEMFTRDTYALGRGLVLKVERHGVRLDLPVRIGKVCFERPMSIPHLKD